MADKWEMAAAAYHQQGPIALLMVNLEGRIMLANDALVAAADEVLRQAKRSGKGMWVAAGVPS